MSRRKRGPKKMIKSQQVNRLPRLDMLRGIAVVAMIAYHFCYDLVYFQWAYFDFQQDWFWQGARFVIVSSFLLLVGIGLQLATVGQNYLNSTHWNRLLKIAACAALVSVGSFLLFGQRFIFFGILHAIVVSSLIGLWLRQQLRLSFIIGSLCLLIGVLFEHPLFNHPALQWLGMMPYAPATEDYVPLLPWLGLVLYGSILGAWLLKSPKWQQHLAVAPESVFSHSLVFLGKRALWVYMLHQPILISLMYMVKTA